MLLEIVSKYIKYKGTKNNGYFKAISKRLSKFSIRELLYVFFAINQHLFCLISTFIRFI